MREDYLLPKVEVMSMGIVNTCGRVFQVNAAGLVHADRWTEDFNEDERRMHDIVLGLRDEYCTPTHDYPGHVHVKLTTDVEKLEIISSIRWLGREELMKMISLLQKIRVHLDDGNESSAASWPQVARLPASSTGLFWGKAQHRLRLHHKLNWHPRRRATRRAKNRTPPVILNGVRPEFP